MLDDEQLIARSAADDREALAELFHRHQKPLYSFFLRSTASREEAEDLAMETLLRVFRCGAQFRGGSFRAWLYRMAVNVAHDRGRRSRCRPEVVASVLPGAWSAAEDSCRAHHPEISALRSDLAVRVQQALRRLPERERTAVLLREYQALSYEEIAGAMRTTVPTVRMLLMRARKQLRRQLEPVVAAGMAEVCP